MSRVTRPLATVLVCASPTDERMPGSAVPAFSIAELSTPLRGAGPPNNASSACEEAASSVGRGAPGAGGTRLKSGGTTSGACRCTANSSGRSRPRMPPPLPQAESIAQPAPRRISVFVFTISTLRSVWRCFIGARFIFISTALIAEEEGSGKDDDHADGDCRIGNVENQERPECAEMQIGIIDHVA